MTTPASVLTAVTAPLATLTAADAAGIAAPLGLLDEGGAQVTDEAVNPILLESGG